MDAVVDVIRAKGRKPHGLTLPVRRVNGVSVEGDFDWSGAECVLVVVFLKNNFK